MDDTWQPRRHFPVGLVTPVPVDPAGRSGPTRGRAAGPRWRRTGPGLFVPAEVPWSAEQRIIEVAAGLPEGALVTGWAALRLYGGAFFDGLDAAMRPLRVPVLVEHRRRLRSDRDRVVLRDRALPAGTVRHGVACVLPQRAVLDAMRVASDGRAAVVVMDMAAAAEVTSIARVRAAWASEPRRQGAALVRFGLAHAHEESRSPTESRLRLIWTLDAGLARPLVNREVRWGDGGLVGVPDLLDPGTGLVAEYDGALHRGRARHRRDNTRRERFFEAGLEPVTVVAGEPVAEVVRRLRAAAARAGARPRAGRGWTCERMLDAEGEPWLPLDARLELRDLDARWHEAAGSGELAAGSRAARPGGESPERNA